MNIGAPDTESVDDAPETPHIAPPSESSWTVHRQRQMLLEAAVRVAQAWEDFSADAQTKDEIDGVLQALTDAVSTGSTDSLYPLASTPLTQALLNRLRAEFVRDLSHAPHLVDPHTLIQLFQRFSELDGSLESDWSQTFSAKLSGPDGMALVVEVAHDLRSPLTSILFLAETLQRGQSGEINELQHRQLGLIYAAGLGLSSLASNVIELARGGDRLIEDQPSPFSVTEVLESVRDIVRPIAEEKGLSVRLHPPVTDHRLGHPIALSRVLLNLVTNSLKFTDEGHVDLEARTKDMTKIEFSVKDTGSGIPEEARAGLFQPFRRAAGRDGYRFSGTGLGLAISRKLVEAMDSTLQVETKPEWGTRFYFVLNMPPANNP